MQTEPHVASHLLNHSFFLTPHWTVIVFFFSVLPLSIMAKLWLLFNRKVWLYMRMIIQISILRFVVYVCMPFEHFLQVKFLLHHNLILKSWFNIFPGISKSKIGPVVFFLYQLENAITGWQRYLLFWRDCWQVLKHFFYPL